MRKTLALTALLLSILSSANARPANLQRQVELIPASIEPDQSEGYISFNVEGEDHPRTLPELVDQSDLIVLAFVQAVYPTYQVDDLGRQTDSLFQIQRRLKGTERAEQIVVAQRGGKIGTVWELTAQFEPVQPGERYILFLKHVTPERNLLYPKRDGIPRYDTRSSATVIRVREDMAYPRRSLAFRPKYEGGPVDQVLADIEHRARQ